MLSREEMARAEDMNRYFRVPSDSRDLHYAKYYVEGECSVSVSEDYTSHNSERLNVAQVKELLLTIDYIRDALNA